MWLFSPRKLRGFRGCLPGPGMGTDSPGRRATEAADGTFQGTCQRNTTLDGEVTGSAQAARRQGGGRESRQERSRGPASQSRGGRRGSGRRERWAQAAPRPPAAPLRSTGLGQKVRRVGSAGAERRCGGKRSARPEPFRGGGSPGRRAAPGPVWAAPATNPRRGAPGAERSERRARRRGPTPGEERGAEPGSRRRPGGGADGHRGLRPGRLRTTRARARGPGAGPAG